MLPEIQSLSVTRGTKVTKTDVFPASYSPEVFLPKKKKCYEESGLWKGRNRMPVGTQSSSDVG